MTRLGLRESADLLEWLTELRSFLSNQEDCDYVGGTPLPNDAMRLLVELDRLFPEVRS